ISCLRHFFSSSRHHPSLPSFPTRRCSDLSGFDRSAPAATTIRRRSAASPSSESRPRHVRVQTPASVSIQSVSQTSVISHGSRPRSEEHTSELQSLRHLVCRLLLEKKKKQV